MFAVDVKCDAQVLLILLKELSTGLSGEMCVVHLCFYIYLSEVFEIFSMVFINVNVPSAS